MKIVPLTLALALTLIAGVLLNSMHATELLALQPAPNGVQKQDGTPTVLKVSLDLHPHFDKHFGKVLTDAPLADSRSLRLRDPKKAALTVVRGWLAAWRSQLALYLG